MRCCSRKRKAGGRSRGGMRNLLFGMLAGLVIGLMFAPKPGVETMNDLREILIRRMPV